MQGAGCAPFLSDILDRMKIGLLVTALTFCSTFCGGLVGLRYRDKLHLILGFTAGVLLGVVSSVLLIGATLLQSPLYWLVSVVGR